MANGETNNNNLPVEQRKCHYCFQMFNKDEMLEDRARLFACDKCYKDQQTSIEAKIWKAGEWVVGGSIMISAVLILAVCFVTIPLAMIMVWKAAFSKENEMEE